MPSKRQKSRSLTVLLLAGALSLALAGGASAVIYVYGNGFSKENSVKEIKRVGGGKKCKKKFSKGSKRMKVKFSGKRLCDYGPPVVGDSGQPNHVIFAKGQIVPKKTPKALRKAAYLAVKVRSGRGDFYELQIRPKPGRFKLVRNPQAGAFSEEGRSDAIRPLKKPNSLRLEVKGARVTAFVNGEKLASVQDSNPEEVAGRKVAFGVGSRKNSKRQTVAAFDRVRVGIAE
jgi:hypothetical protein